MQIRHGESAPGNAERKFRRVRNMALAVCAASLAIATEVQATEMAAISAFSLYTAGTFEALRFLASPDAPRKRLIMGRVNKVASALMFSGAALAAAEGVSLIASAGVPAGSGLMNMRNFLAEKPPEEPDHDGERYGFAAADFVMAGTEAAVAVSFLRRRETRPPQDFQAPVVE